jgi:hypothetical protein
MGYYGEDELYSKEYRNPSKKRKSKGKDGRWLSKENRCDDIDPNDFDFSGTQGAKNERQRRRNESVRSVIEILSLKYCYKYCH